VLFRRRVTRWCPQCFYEDGGFVYVCGASPLTPNDIFLHQLPGLFVFWGGFNFFDICLEHISDQ
jgi:hypothetical protein